MKRCVSPFAFGALTGAGGVVPCVDILKPAGCTQALPPSRSQGVQVQVLRGQAVRWYCTPTGSGSSSGTSGAGEGIHDAHGHGKLPPLSQQYFALFGFPIDCELSVAELTKRYRHVQMLIHPDKKNQTSESQQQHSQRDNEKEGNGNELPTTGADANEAEMAAMPHHSKITSVAANGAYETLKTPFKRYKYLSKLLRVNNVTIKEVRPLSDAALKLAMGSGGSDDQLQGSCPLAIMDDGHTREGESHSTSTSSDATEGGAVGVAGNVTLPMEFLMSVMELNERVDGLHAPGVLATEEGKKEYEELNHTVRAQCNELMADASISWQQHNDEGFHEAVSKWTYYHNLLQQLHNMEL